MAAEVTRDGRVRQGIRERIHSSWDRRLCEFPVKEILSMRKERSRSTKARQRIIGCRFCLTSLVRRIGATICDYTHTDGHPSW